MQRQRFSREFKLEAVKLIKERGVSVAQAARDIDVAERSMSTTLRQPGSVFRLGIGRGRWEGTGRFEDLDGARVGSQA